MDETGDTFHDADKYANGISPSATGFTRPRL